MPLASATLNAARWLEMWPTAMALYLAHLATLWLISEGSVASVPGAAAHDLSESRRGSYDIAVPIACSLDTGIGGRIVSCQLDQALRIENQRAAYSSS